ncbi:ester cyclase [Streptomyces sp. MUM 203J]|uniref:ester cyclase n=1 Tax=Streptomyces sp. MUM 203J TaxID=2791990 RepID=UPI001F03D14F|nr:ester cyclase [Streptomyces sp. MUM 203J]MCH0541423.1 ester cyclase [Streptomyces sp. MUM 203J]
MDRAGALQLMEHFLAAYNEGDPRHLDHCLHPEYRHPDPAAERGIQGMRKAVSRWSASVEGLRLTLDDLVVEGDKVVARMTFSGRQVGAVLGIPPSGRRFSIGLIDIFLVEDGLFAQHWDEMDLLGLHRQLGALPA